MPMHDWTRVEPLERAYRTAWDASPSDFRHLVETGRLPDEE